MNAYTMIIHSVVFTPKHAPGSHEEKNLLDAAISLKAIESVRNFKAYRQVSKKNSFRFGLSMEFETDAGYQAYNEDPRHVEFVQNRWIPEVEDFMEIDYVDYE